jgi:hypothetical protein
MEQIPRLFPRYEHSTAVDCLFGYRGFQSDGGNKMNNKLLRSALTFLAIFPILFMVMSALAQAPNQDDRPNIEPHDNPSHSSHNIILNIDPHETKVNSSPEYQATMEAKSAPSGGFFFLNLKIPKGYKFTFPSKGERVAQYTWFNKTNHSKVIVDIIANNTITKTVDVRFSTNSGHTFIKRRGLPITNMVIGTVSLKFTEPSSSNVGYLNLSLGGTAGPILGHEKVIVDLAKGTLKNPGIAGEYTWFIVARNNTVSFTASDVVKVKSKK